jgi:hypothetical protein
MLTSNLKILTFAPPGGRFTISTTRTLRPDVETVTGYETHHAPDRTVNRISSYDDRSKFAFFAPTRHLADDFRTNEDLGRQRPTTCTGPPSGGKIGCQTTERDAFEKSRIGDFWPKGARAVNV